MNELDDNRVDEVVEYGDQQVVLELHCAVGEQDLVQGLWDEEESQQHLDPELRVEGFPGEVVDEGVLYQEVDDLLLEAVAVEQEEDQGADEAAEEDDVELLGVSVDDEAQRQVEEEVQGQEADHKQELKGEHADDEALCIEQV